jgi:hypothetical protein
MKLHKIISSCALALGLAAITTGNAQASVVITNTLYTPLNVKAIITYNDHRTGKLRQTSVNTKNFLKAFGHAGDRLVVSIGTSGAGDVFIVKGDKIVEDLTVGGYAFLTTDELVNHSSGNNKREQYTASGILTLNAYSNPVFTNVAVSVRSGSQNSAVSQLVGSGFDQAASEAASDVWLEVSGPYTYTETLTVPGKNGKTKEMIDLKSTDLSGQGFDLKLSGLNLPVAAGLTGIGSGTVLVVP